MSPVLGTAVGRDRRPLRGLSIMADEVLYEVADQIAIITINRPEKRNALNAAVRQGLWDAWRRFEADAHARVGILTGAGEKAFCAGRVIQPIDDE